MTVAAPAPPLSRAGFADLLRRFYDRLDAAAMLEESLRRDLARRVALVASFGAESVALIHLVSRIAPETPVIFLDTEMLFPETLRYQRRVADELGLADLRVVRPDPAEVGRLDPEGALHRADKDACCALRKTAPLARALGGFDAWITGRKRAHGGARVELPKVELDDDGKVKLNPLATWTPRDVAAYIDANDLPRHPLVERGYPSIGCAPCTTKAAPGEAPRAGRWRGDEKTECGIHMIDGRFVPAADPSASI